MKIVIAKNYRNMSRLAADQVIEQIRNKPSSVLGLPTGHTPVELYHDLVLAYQQEIIRFKKIVTFNLDEYAGLESGDKRSYHTYMKTNLFNKIDIQSKNIHILDGATKNVKRECVRFESEISRAGGIDLLILGIGMDDHIGFNEPGSDFKSRTRLVKLAETTREANSKYFGSLKRTPTAALTVGIGTIMEAKKIILLADGKKKAEAIARAVNGKIDPQVPASILQKHPDCTFILDKGAAAKLKS